RNAFESSRGEWPHCSPRMPRAQAPRGLREMKTVRKRLDGLVVGHPRGRALGGGALDDDGPDVGELRERPKAPSAGSYQDRSSRPAALKSSAAVRRVNLRLISVSSRSPARNSTLQSREAMGMRWAIADSRCIS